MSKTKKVSEPEAREIGNKLGIDWSKIDIEEFRIGLQVEQEHDAVTKGDMLLVARTALDHLEEYPSFYTEHVKWEKTLKKRK